MTPSIQVRVEAEQDLIDHYAYLSQRSEEAAERFIAATSKTFEQLARMPGMGALRDYGNPLLKGMRMRPVQGFRKHLIFYLPTDAGIEIVRVLHGARNIPKLFE